MLRCSHTPLVLSHVCVDEESTESDEDIKFDNLANHRALKFSKKNKRRGGESQEDYLKRCAKIIARGLKGPAQPGSASATAKKKKADGIDYWTKFKATLRSEFVSQGGKREIRPQKITEHRVNEAGAREYHIKYYCKGYEVPPPAWKPADYCLQYSGLVEDYMAVSITPSITSYCP